MDREAMEIALTLMGWVPCRMQAGNAPVVGITQANLFWWIPQALGGMSHAITHQHVLVGIETAIAEDWHVFEDWQIESLYYQARAKVNRGS